MHESTAAPQLTGEAAFTQAVAEVCSEARLGRYSDAELQEMAAYLGNFRNSKRVLVVGDITYDTAQDIAWRSGKELYLNRIERKILHFFLLNPLRYFNTEEILKAVWGDRPMCRTNVGTQIFSLRRKLGADGDERITNTPGRGYRFNPSR